MKIIIVEDELHSSRLLKGMLEELRPDWDVLETFESVSSTVAWLNDNPSPDLIFLDIQLNDGICFSIFEQSKVESMVIFTTAYDEYAIQAFKVNSIDYLLKPIKRDKLLQAINKFEKMSKAQGEEVDPVDVREVLNAIKQGEKKYRKRFLISGTTAYFKIQAQDVAYFYTENRVSYAVTFDAKEHILDLTMERLEEQLDPELFFRANRSVILNSEAVRKFENHFGGKLMVRLVTPFKNPVTISRLKASEFKEWLGS